MDFYYENYIDKTKFLKLLRALAFTFRLLPLEFLKLISLAKFIIYQTHCRRTYQPECFCYETLHLNFIESNIFAAYFFKVVFILSEFNRQTLFFR